METFVLQFIDDPFMPDYWYPEDYYSHPERYKAKSTLFVFPDRSVLRLPYGQDFFPDFVDFVQQQSNALLHMNTDAEGVFHFEKWVSYRGSCSDWGIKGSVTRYIEEFILTEEEGEDVLTKKVLKLSSDGETSTHSVHSYQPVVYRDERSVIRLLFKECKVYCRSFKGTGKGEKGTSFLVCSASGKIFHFDCEDDKMDAASQVYQSIQTGMFLTGQAAAESDPGAIQVHLEEGASDRGSRLSCLMQGHIDEDSVAVKCHFSEHGDDQKIKRSGFELRNYQRVLLEEGKNSPG